MPELRSSRSGILSIREKRILRYIIFFVIISRIALAFRSEERIYTRPYYEDSFYLFNCAEHVAHSQGFTCDGKQPTNGVQPLVVLLYVPLFLIAGANKLLALRLGFILIALVDSISVILIAKLIRTLQKIPGDDDSPWFSPPIIGAALWAVLYPILVHTTGGMETGLYSALILATLFSYTHLNKKREMGMAVSKVAWSILGIILGFTVLARIDAVFLVIIIAGYELVRQRRNGMISGAIISLVSFLVSSPWWLYNYKVFGSIMPQSGVSESLRSGILGENMRRGAIVIGDILGTFIILPNYQLPTWFHFMWPVLIIVIIAWLARKTELKIYLASRFNLGVLIPYLVFCTTLVVYYVFFFSAPHFLPRYFHPLRIAWIILFACSAPKILTLMQEHSKNWPMASRSIITLFVVVPFGFGTVLYTKHFLVEQSSDFYKTGLYALQHPNEKFGMEQSGTAGFIAANVINLDGKVNISALHAIQAGDIGAYIESERFDYIADWREFSSRIVESAAKHGGHFQEVDQIGRVVIYKRIGEQTDTK